MARARRKCPAAACDRVARTRSSSRSRPTGVKSAARSKSPAASEWARRVSARTADFFRYRAARCSNPRPTAIEKWWASCGSTAGSAASALPSRAKAIAACAEARSYGSIASRTAWRVSAWANRYWPTSARYGLDQTLGCRGRQRPVDVRSRSARIHAGGPHQLQSEGFADHSAPGDDVPIARIEPGQALVHEYAQ